MRAHGRRRLSSGRKHRPPPEAVRPVVRLAARAVSPPKRSSRTISPVALPWITISAQGVHFQGDDRSGELGAPADISRGVHHRQLAFEGCRRDRTTREVGDCVSNRTPEMVRALVPPALIEPLDAQGIAARQDHRGIAIDRESADVRHQAIMPEGLGLEPLLATIELQADAFQHPEGGRHHRHRLVGDEAEMRDRLQGLEPADRPCIPIDQVQDPVPRPDRDIAAMRIDRHECRVGGRRALLLDGEIGVQEEQAGIRRVDQQGDQGSRRR